MPKTQHILGLHHGQIRHAGPDAAHHAPVHTFLFGQIQVLDGALNIVRQSGFKPAVHRLIIMGASVSNAVGGVAVGAVVTAVTAVKGKFQDFHAGVGAFFQQSAHIVGQKAQVLSNNAGAAQLFFDGSKEGIARPSAPAAVFGGLITIGDGVIPRKAAEMVNAQHIINSAQVADAAHPPGIAVGSHSVPVKQRVAP